MRSPVDTEKCPCESGYEYINCCGFEGRTAQNTHITAKITLEGITCAPGTPSGSTPELDPELTPELANALENVTNSADMFLARLNIFEGRAYFVKMSPRWYRESVFLDPNRMRGTCVIESDLPWLQQMAEQVTPADTPVIFHTAFCGSTLMTQALESLYNCLSLREPEILGNLLMYARSDIATDAMKEQWVNIGMNQLARHYQPGQIVVAKANDFANALMSYLVSYQQTTPILFMFTSLDEFLVGCLKAKNRRNWIRQRYQMIKDIAASILDVPEGLVIEDDAYAEMAAMYWSYNIALYQKSYKSAPNQIRSLNFKTMLARPAETIAACGEWFGLKELPDVGKDEALASLFGSYSKNSKIDYSPEKRSAEIKLLLSRNRENITVAENLADCLLGDDYPAGNLPGQLLQ